MSGIKIKANSPEFTNTGASVADSLATARVGKSSVTSQLKPSQKMIDAARAGKILSGERFAMFKQAGRGLWNNKGGLIAGLVVGGGAVAAGLMHAQWLPTALHLATTPVGIGVLAGIAGLALLAGGLYLGRQMTTSVKNALANNAHAAIKQEKNAEKQAAKLSKMFAGDSAPAAAEKIAEKASAEPAAEVVAKPSEQPVVTSTKAVLETAASTEDSLGSTLSRQVSAESNYSDALAQRELSTSTTLSGVMRKLDREQVIASHRAA